VLQLISYLHKKIISLKLTPRPLQKLRFLQRQEHKKPPIREFHNTVRVTNEIIIITINAVLATGGTTKETLGQHPDHF